MQIMLSLKCSYRKVAKCSRVRRIPGSSYKILALPGIRGRSDSFSELIKR